MADERRASKRFSIKQFIDVSSGDDDFLQATAMNLSAGGLSCTLKSPLQPMTPIFVMIGLHQAEGGEKVLKLDGYVAHSRMDKGVCYAGISFVEVSPPNRELLDLFLADLGQ
jgi:hypothetical protein